MPRALGLVLCLASLPAAAAFSVDKAKDHASGVAELEKAWAPKQQPKGVENEKWAEWKHVYEHVTTNTGGDQLYLARDGASIEGAMSVSIGGPTGDMLLIQALVTAPKNLAPGGKRGAGSALSAAAIELAVAQKVRAIGLIPDNKDAEDFWTARGFKPTGKGAFDLWELDARDFEKFVPKKQSDPLTPQSEALIKKEPPLKGKKPKTAATHGCCIVM